MRKKTDHNIQLNLNVRGLGDSATLAINQTSARLAAEGKQVYKLGLGQSPFPVPPSVVAALQAHAAEKDYLPVRGLYALREAVAAYHRRTQHLDFCAENILVGPGTKELMFLLQITYYGDLVVPSPSWVSYAPQAQIIGRKVRWLATQEKNDWRLMPEDLALFCSEDSSYPRIVILNYPANPTGSTYPAAELKALAKVARQYKVILLADEIYSGLHHQGQHVSIARYYPEGTIVSNGLSKWCGAGGWRLGTFAFPPALQWLLEGMASVASETYTSTSAPIQYAAIEGFADNPDIDHYIALSRRICGALGRHITKKLQQADVAVATPKGGFYLFPNFSAHAENLRARGIEDGPTLCARLLDETGVAILPGSDFGRPREELTARLAYVDFDGGAALAALAASGNHPPAPESYLPRYCARVLEAVDRVIDWLKQTED
ncbi:pyridoxal phosphate-dependent aminotransferase [Acanthopleuribacter pedis]|uniref:Aminotransferase n=1 Tax=Acanthopleuribacter pedis TaxID=442870 RepID=A0A8J7QSW9_9BACT|nr:aminotransferase class I/II-fold pyridoxal phosphate-dependent enzyme [Acanthopleuribacter pedis]MBO1323153.1 aminotransferase class I/II-fold pyridoxal phosphate-dependent enzyme [Acanthopleuribacter pedis]